MKNKMQGQIIAGIVACEIARVLYEKGVNDFHFTP